MTPQPWMCSLHGAHSSEFCEHAHSTLREMVEAAISAGYDTFGMSEHCARVAEQYVFLGERPKGITAQQLVDMFDAYAKASKDIVDEYGDRIHLLRGFEAEVVPPKSYDTLTAEWRRQYRFDYIVGSVHFMYEECVDEDKEYFGRLIDAAGSLEELCCEYYRTVAEMITRLKPEVVGHFDLIRLFGRFYGNVDTPTVMRSAEEAMSAAAEVGAILDLNTAGIRKGIGHPYPAPVMVQLAKKMGVPFCFGDDSHNTEQVGFGLPEARQYLLQNGIDTITTLAKHGSEVVHEVRPL